MREKANFNSRIMRRLSLLQQFSFRIKYVKGHENLSDSLSRVNMSDMESKSMSYHYGPVIEEGEILLQVAKLSDDFVEAKELYKAFYERLQTPEFIEFLA